MSPISPTVAHLRGRVNALTRYIQAGDRRPDDPVYLTAKRDLAAATLEEHITRVVAAAPPLTAAQISTLSALFNDGTAPVAKPTKPRGRRSA